MPRENFFVLQVLADFPGGFACLARLEPREMHIAPLATKPLVRDLVTEIGPPPERLGDG